MILIRIKTEVKTLANPRYNLNMGRLEDFLSGTTVLEEVKSPINGKISVIKSLAFGTYIQVDGLTQSGGVVKDVWKTSLKKVANRKKKVERVLILGLGGGSAAKLVRKFWPASAELRPGKTRVKITGVELDPLMINLGKKYLGLKDLDVDIRMEDAYEFCKKAVEKGEKFDLVLNDVYVGHVVPKKLESENYIHLVRELLSEPGGSPSRRLARGGVAIFNRLYYGEKRAEAVKFGEKLEQIFKKVDVVYPEANVMFICRNYINN